MEPALLLELPWEATGGLNNETAQAIMGGTYTVRVTDNVTPNQWMFIYYKLYDNR